MTELTIDEPSPARILELFEREGWPSCLIDDCAVIDLVYTTLFISLRDGLVCVTTLVDLPRGASVEAIDQMRHLYATRGVPAKTVDREGLLFMVVDEAMLDYPSFDPQTYVAQYLLADQAARQIAVFFINICKNWEFVKRNVKQAPTVPLHSTEDPDPYGYNSAAALRAAATS